MTLSASLAPPLHLSAEASIKDADDAGCDVLVGISSWSDRSLTHESNWYPKRSMKAAERMAFYATRFPLVEIETTFRFPPTPVIADQWIERTPPGFKFDIQAWSLFTGQPTMRNSLWEDLFDEVRVEMRDRPRLYTNHLSRDAVEECWKRFNHAIQPLRRAGRLGTVIFRYPRWFGPGDSKREALTELRHRMGDTPVAVQFSNPEWVRSEFCESTFSFLEELDLSFVCVDANDDDPRGLAGAAATTNDIGVVRLLGRRDHEEGEDWTPEWRGYRYSEEETQQTAKRLSYLADSCKELHVLYSTTWRDDSALNAEQMQSALAERRVIDLR